MLVSNVVSNGKLEFVNKKSISKINLGFRILFAIFFAFVLLIVFKDITLTSTLTIFVVVVYIMIYNLSNAISRIDLTEDSISFINTIYNKEMTFSYDEITEFKSVVNTQQGLSYNTIDIAFGNKFSTTLFENEYNEFNKMKLYIQSKIN